MYYTVLERFTETQLLQQIDDLSNLEKNLLSDTKAKSRRRTLRNQKDRIRIHINNIKIKEELKMLLNNEDNMNSIENNNRNSDNNDDNNSNNDDGNNKNNDNNNIISNNLMKNSISFDSTVPVCFEITSTLRNDGSQHGIFLKNLSLTADNVCTSEIEEKKRQELDIESYFVRYSNPNSLPKGKNLQIQSTNQNQYEANGIFRKQKLQNKQGEVEVEVEAPEAKLNNQEKEMEQRCRDEERELEKERNLDPKIPDLITPLSHDNIPINPKTRLGWGFWKS